ncbi:MAG: hypothetical protein KDA24_23860 [Deltaproteobacteria bacterium]|nr:hypothetical protein [Deltaproteobacteria bacterium]
MRFQALALLGAFSLLVACEEVPVEPPEPTPAPRGPGCEAAGYDATAFTDTDEDYAFDAVARDARMETLSGTWRLSEAWGDCSVFTLVPLDSSFADHSVQEVVESSEPNNTYLFYSWRADREPELEDLRDRIDDALEEMGEGVAAAWGPRFRYVIDDPDDVPLLRTTATIQTDYFFIDSRQKLRDAGSFRAFNGDFVPLFEMIRYAARWFNYERRTEEKVTAEAADPDVLIVPWLTTGYDQTATGVFPIELPSAADMARYDRMEIVVKETCEPGARFPVHYGLCPAWDVGHKVTLCADEASCVSGEKNQLYRFVTGYHSGVWLYEDVTHGLPWFQEGGTRWLRTDRNNFWGTIEFHFFDDGEPTADEHVIDAVHLIDMGRAQFDAAHNDSFPAYSFTPPAGTTRVVMDARVQGGGNQAGNGCAEFCSHHHAIDLNGSTWENTFVMESGVFSCAEKAHEGVTSGQFGTWFIDRGSWCPGGPVERWRQDVTEAVDLQGENTLRWTGSFAGNEWPPGGGTTATVWLIFFGEGDGEAQTTRLPVETCPNPATVTVRDFARADVDFEPIKTAWSALEDGDPDKEGARGVLTGVVAEQLTEVEPGVWKPQMVWPENTLPYTTSASFDDWWRDSARSQVVPPSPESLRRTRMDTLGYFRSNAEYSVEFPLIAADSGFGDEGVVNNYEGGTPVNSTFTVELSGEFTYEAGMRLRLGSRADLWVFVDRELALESAGFLGKGFPKNILSLDTLGLTEGDTYDLHVFAVGGRGAESNPMLWLEHPACL